MSTLSPKNYTLAFMLRNFQILNYNWLAISRIWRLETHLVWQVCVACWQSWYVELSSTRPQWSHDQEEPAACWRCLSVLRADVVPTNAVTFVVLNKKRVLKTIKRVFGASIQKHPARLVNELDMNILSGLRADTLSYKKWFRFSGKVWTALWKVTIVVIRSRLLSFPLADFLSFLRVYSKKTVQAF